MTIKKYYKHSVEMGWFHFYNCKPKTTILKDKLFDESEVKKYMEWYSIDLEVNLNLVHSSFTVYTCDFTHDYIDINADYRN